VNASLPDLTQSGPVVRLPTRASQGFPFFPPISIEQYYLSSSRSLALEGGGHILDQADLTKRGLTRRHCPRLILRGMSKNDIDDIFSKSKKSDPISSQASQSRTSKTAQASTPKTAQGLTSKKAQGSDPKASSVIPSVIPTRKAATKHVKGDDLFTDLKGKGSRKQTTEGFSVYNDEELKIDPNAGMTDACPFDCQCTPPTIFLHTENELILRRLLLKRP